MRRARSIVAGTARPACTEGGLRQARCYLNPVRFQSPVSYVDPDESAARKLEIEADNEEEDEEEVDE